MHKKSTTEIRKNTKKQHKKSTTEIRKNTKKQHKKQHNWIRKKAQLNWPGNWPKQIQLEFLKNWNCKFWKSVPKPLDLLLKWTGGPGDPGGLGVGLAEAPAQRCQAFRAAPPPLQPPMVTTTIASGGSLQSQNPIPIIQVSTFRLQTKAQFWPFSSCRKQVIFPNLPFPFDFDFGVLERVLALFPRAGLNCCTPPLIGKINSTGFQVSEFGSFGLLFGFRGRPNNLRAQQSAEFLSIRLLCAPKMWSIQVFPTSGEMPVYFRLEFWVNLHDFSCAFLCCFCCGHCYRLGAALHI